MYHILGRQLHWRNSQIVIDLMGKKTIIFILHSVYYLYACTVCTFVHSVLSCLDYDLELVVLCPCELVQKALDAYKNESAPTPREDSDGGEEGGEEGEREEVEGIKPSAVVEAEPKITEEEESGNVMEGEETVTPEKPTKQVN